MQSKIRLKQKNVAKMFMNSTQLHTIQHANNQMTELHTAVLKVRPQIFVEPILIREPC